ncbi:MAG: hypothetical protein JXR78_05545 [Victivallales bacterium]|nr:hypothetical protein [Victivallales bacterium]
MRDLVCAWCVPGIYQDFEYMEKMRINKPLEHFLVAKNSFKLIEVDRFCS